MQPSSGLMSVEEAQQRILSQVQILGAEERPLLEALGQALAEDIYAGFNIPPMDNSAMDGYAVRAEDISTASETRPVPLRIIGLVAAGYTTQTRVVPGTAVRIMTGAPIPPGADTVVPFEETDELEQRQRGALSAGLTEIAIRMAAPKGSSVRPLGEDAKQGALILSQGTLLRAAHMGVLASLGRSTVQVIRRPTVAILATGDELREPGETLGPGQIYNSNSYSTAALVISCGAMPRVLPIARDTVSDLTSKIREGLEADLFITSAGVSTGEYDLVKDVLTQQGSMDFWRVRMRPGKPLAFGLLRRDDGTLLPHIGLPGNPVSSMIAFDQFARPAILMMMGKPLASRRIVNAVLEEPVENPDQRRFYARAVLRKDGDHYYVRLTGSQGSNVLTSMTLANCLIVVPEQVTQVNPGEQVDVQILEGYEDLFS